MATAWRYVQEAINLLTTTDLHTTIEHLRRLPYVILDGTLIPIDRVADAKPYYSGKQRHGMNVQVIASPRGHLLRASPALPGAAHDLTAANTHGIIDALTSAGITTLADKAYQGAPANVCTPLQSHPPPQTQLRTENRQQRPHPHPRTHRNPRWKRLDEPQSLASAAHGRSPGRTATGAGTRRRLIPAVLCAA